jgi:hypothetical protein
VYSQLHTQMIRSRQEEIAARTIHRHDAPDAGVGATWGSGRIRRLAGQVVAGLAVCTAATCFVAITDGSARANRHSSVSARQFQREMNALERAGFVATSCEINGTLMKNYSTGKSVLLPL